MYRHPLTILLFLLLSGSCLGQTSIRGSIIDDEGQTVAWANLFNLNSKEGTASGPQGAFSLSAKAGDSIRISYIGYVTHLHVVSTADLQAPVAITLQLNTQLLREVVVRARFEEPLLARSKGEFKRVQGLPYVPNPKPVKPLSIAGGNSFAKDPSLVQFPVPTLNATIVGPFTYFSKEAKEKRRFEQLEKEAAKEELFREVMNKPATRAMLLRVFEIDEPTCDRLLSRFHACQPRARTLKTEYLILERLLDWFRGELQKPQDE